MPPSPHPDPPPLRVTLTPHFSPSPLPQHISALSVHTIIPAPALPLHAPLVTLLLALSHVPTQHYSPSSETPLRASDASGPLPLRIHNTASHRTWHVARPTHGDVTLRHRAVPRAVDAHTPIGPRIDLRSQPGGGLVGSGLSFIPLPPDAAALYSCSVTWDLSGAAAGTRAVWTFGEGPGTVVQVGPASVLANSAFAVGAVRRFRLPGSAEGGRGKRRREGADEGGEDGGRFGIYYFGDLPACIERVAGPVQELFERMAGFFRDPGLNPYRVFVRDARPARGYGGTAMIRSYILEYDGEIGGVSDEEMFALLAHEMVHNWAPVLKHTTEEEDAAEGGETGWFVEGIAEFYACFLPYRFGLRGREWVTRVGNGMLSAYYTNPLVGLGNAEAAERAGASGEAARLAYKRGFTYLVNVDAQLREVSKAKVSLDDLVFALLEKKGRGEALGVQQWVELVDSYLGESAVDEYRAMAAGQLIVPAEDCLAHEGLRLVRQDQEVFELGFWEESLNERVMGGLVQGSRAERAGVREGHRVLRSGFLWQVRDEFERQLRVVVERGREGGEGEEEDDWETDREMEIIFWPRGWEKVECWQWVVD